MKLTKDILQEIETQTTNYLTNNMPAQYVYHDLEHTLNVVSSCIELGEKYFLSKEEMTLLTIAAWFHDTGYVDGPDKHEERSANRAADFLTQKGIESEQIEIVKNIILSTQLPQQPKTLLEKIICDADLNHLGKDSYWERCVKVRQEFMTSKGKIMSEEEWLSFEINFLEHQSYHTEIAEAYWGKQKRKHLKQLQKLRLKLFPTEEETLLSKKKKKGKKKKKKVDVAGADVEIKQLNLGRGVETMYRATYRTHVNLSAMADNKANIMLSINAIIISIVLSTLVPQLQENQNLLIPTLVLLATCLLAIVYATLSTKPKVTEGRFSREDIEKKRSNLLFFGNFYNMDLKDFHWGMTEMIKDEDFLYSSMTRDIYWLGKVLAKKYRLLGLCYNIFMYGLIASVVAFTIAYAL